MCLKNLTGFYKPNGCNSPLYQRGSLFCLITREGEKFQEIESRWSSISMQNFSVKPYQFSTFFTAPALLSFSIFPLTQVFHDRKADWKDSLHSFQSHLFAQMLSPSTLLSLVPCSHTEELLLFPLLKVKFFPQHALILSHTHCLHPHHGPYFNISLKLGF